jgi:hypothetical protein
LGLNLTARNHDFVVFSYDVARFLVAPNAAEARVAQSILWRPFQKLDSSDE